MGTIKRNETRAEKVMKKLESLLCTAGNVKWCSCCRKCYGYDFLNILYTEVSYDPEVLLLDVYLKRNESRDANRYMYTHVHSVLSTTAKKQKQHSIH